MDRRLPRGTIAKQEQWHEAVDLSELLFRGYSIWNDSRRLQHQSIEMDYAQVIRLPQYFRNFQRLSEIVRILVKHGFGDLLARINVYPYLETGFRLLNSSFVPSPNASLDIATRLRLACEELGPTFVKFGQVVATRPDLFGVPLTEEFRKLQDRALPFPGSVSRTILEEEFGLPITELFASFEDTPLAAGSIAQIHRARLTNGSEVAVKVQRPNLERVMETDIDILRGLATLAEEHIIEIKNYAPRKLVEEFARSLKGECDFRREMASLKKFRDMHSAQVALLVPRVYEQLCSKRVLTEQFVEGWRVDTDPVQETLAGTNRGKELAATLSDVLLTSIFEHGFYHADPHPGNILVTGDLRIALLDYGSMGRLDSARLSQILQFLVALFSESPETMVKVLRESGMLAEDCDELSLRSKIADLMDLYLGASLGNLHLGSLLSDLFDIIRRHELKVPADLFLIAKSLTMLEHIGRKLDPTFVPATTMYPYLAERYMATLRDPERYIRATLEVADEYRRLGVEFPVGARRLLKRLSGNNFTIHTSSRDQEVVVQHQNRIANRFIMAGLAIALLVSGLLLNFWSRAGIDGTASYLLMAWGAILVLFVLRAVRRSGGMS